MDERVQKWLRGVRNGVSPLSLVQHKVRGSYRVRIKGVDIDAPSDLTTWRIVEDIWMKGEYDVPGFIPQPGWRVIDIGGNVGIYAMLAASRGAKVTSYEPHPDSARALRANTRKWDVTVREAAVVGQPSGPVRLFIHPERDTRNTLVGKEVGRAQTPLEHSIEVPTVPISEVLTEPCDLLKVDCEGGEFDIFAHGREALANARRIIAEVHVNVDDPNRALGDVQAAGFKDARLHQSHGDAPFVLLTATR